MENRGVIIQKSVEDYLDKTYDGWRMTNPSIRYQIPWSDIAITLTGVVNTRSGAHLEGRHILEMWINQLDPRLNRQAFTTEELEHLKKKYLEAKTQGKTLERGKVQLPEGYTWNNVLPEIYRRSPNDVKNAYYTNQRYWSGQVAQPVSVPVSVSHEVSSEVPARDNGYSEYDISPDNELFSSDSRIIPLIDETPTPFAFSLPNYTPPGAAASDFGSSFDERGGGKSARKSARKPSRKSFRKSSRKAKKSSRKYRKVTRK